MGRKEEDQMDLPARHLLGTCPVTAMLLFAMPDGSTVPVLRSFVEQHLDNGVVPRLLGFPMADGLSTPQPSVDNQQRLTILCQLGMDKHDFLDLLQLLRTRDVTVLALQGARRAALLLGGVEAVDTYVPPAMAPACPYHPVCPEQDTLDRFHWTVSLDVDLRENNLVEEHGWSVMGGTGDQFRYYLRKPKGNS